jgi:hypothetical protein
MTNAQGAKIYMDHFKSTLIKNTLADIQITAKMQTKSNIRVKNMISHLQIMALQWCFVVI